VRLRAGEPGVARTIEVLLEDDEVPRVADARTVESIEIPVSRY
jgi:hypothetical protein